MDHNAVFWFEGAATRRKLRQVQYPSLSELATPCTDCSEQLANAPIGCGSIKRAREPSTVAASLSPSASICRRAHCRQPYSMLMHPALCAHAITVPHGSHRLPRYARFLSLSCSQLRRQVTVNIDRSIAVYNAQLDEFLRQSKAKSRAEKDEKVFAAAPHHHLPPCSTCSHGAGACMQACRQASVPTDSRTAARCGVGRPSHRVAISNPPCTCASMPVCTHVHIHPCTGVVLFHVHVHPCTGGGVRALALRPNVIRTTSKPPPARRCLTRVRE